MRLVLLGIVFALGVALGGWLFADTQPRSILAVGRCTDCWTLQDLAGLLGWAGMQRAAGALPGIEIETDRTVALRSPIPEARTHYVILPKRDIRNVGELAAGDEAYRKAGPGPWATQLSRFHPRSRRSVGDLSPLPPGLERARQGLAQGRSTTERLTTSPATSSRA